MKSQAHNGAARRQCGSEALEPEEMIALWKDLEQQLKEIKNQKTVNLSVKWNVIYKVGFKCCGLNHKLWLTPSVAGSVSLRLWFSVFNYWLKLANTVIYILFKLSLLFKIKILGLFLIKSVVLRIKFII